jgi:LuxR family transcriptional regulator, maltose regulon positive regulatory protein
MAWRVTGLEEKLHAAEAAVAAYADSAGGLDTKTRDLLGQVACARATLALTRYDLQTMLSESRRALDYLHPENHRFLFTANWASAAANLMLGERATAAQACQQAIAYSQKSGSVFSRMLATTIQGNLQKMSNQLHQAAQTYRQVLELSGDNPIPNAGQVQLNLAEIYYEWNDLEAAEQNGIHSLELMRQYNQLVDRFLIGEAFLARLTLTRGDVAGAAALLARAEQSAHHQNFLLRLPDIAAVQVLVLIQQDQLVKAEQLAHQYELPLSQARVYLAQGDPSAALALLNPLRQQAETRGWADELLKVMVLEAIALQAHGEKERAAQVLGEALALAEPGGFVRIFVDEGERMRSLLENQLRSGAHPLSGYVAKLLAAFPQSGGCAKVHQYSAKIRPDRAFERTRAGSAQAAAQRIKRPRNSPTTDRVAQHRSYSHQKHIQKIGGQQSPGGCPPRRRTRSILADPKSPPPAPQVFTKHLPGLFVFANNHHIKSHHVVMTPPHLGRYPCCR